MVARARSWLELATKARKRSEELEADPFAERERILGEIEAALFQFSSAHVSVKH
jgi:hypothetical protein